MTGEKKEPREAAATKPKKPKNTAKPAKKKRVFTEEDAIKALTIIENCLRQMEDVRAMLSDK